MIDADDLESVLIRVLGEQLSLSRD